MKEFALGNGTVTHIHVIPNKTKKKEIEVSLLDRLGKVSLLSFKLISTWTFWDKNHLSSNLAGLN